jgi:S1-C subfamily serine protease
MNLIDVIVVGACILGVITGYRRGALLALFSFAGLLLGAVLGAQLVDPLAREFTDGSVTVRVPIALFCVLTLAIVGQLIGGWIGSTMRQHVTWRPAAQLDAVLGAIASVVATLVVAWLIAVPLASASSPSLSAQIRDSRIVSQVDALMPDSADELYASLRDYLDQSGFPRVFGALERSRVSDVAPPDETLVNSAGVAAVRDSVLKIRGDAGGCGRAIEGSGFVYAPEHMLTNAHVVAGTDTVRVLTDDGSLRAKVVLFDPRRDVAVLDVPGLTAAPLSFATADARSGDGAVVIGYPEDGPFDVRAARVRDHETLYGRDIYDSGDVGRDVYAVRSLVRSGNSGGPLIAPDGSVLGMVFAAALDEPDTGFALSAAEIAEAGVAAAAQSSAAVGTGQCAP